MEWIGWLQIGISIICGMTAGIVSARASVARISKREQRVDDQLDTMEGRLDAGDQYIGGIPVLDEALRGVRAELAEIKKELRSSRETYVSRRECDMRHNRREAVKP